MKFGKKLILSSSIVAAIAVIGPAFSLNYTARPISPAPQAGIVHRSVIKVHTEHGVITVPGSGESWESVENAIFVADGIADVEVANNVFPWQASNR